jgi:hypothetical protein
MPDTGLPWEIPYAAPADLVRDWPALSEDVADAVAAGLSAAGNAGIGSNVVQTVKTDTFTTTSSSYVDVTGLTATITPSSDTSKVLVIANINVGQSAANGSVAIQITSGGSAVFIGDASGSRTRVSTGYRGSNGSESVQAIYSQTAVFLDSPATDSAQTYAIQISTPSSTAQVNRSGTDGNASTIHRGASSLTLIEVAA